MAKTELKEIEVSKISPTPQQPREHFDREKIKELAESVLSNGLINPIQVRKKGNRFEIVAGERRWKAHQMANIKKIPAIIKEYKSEGEVAIESLIENVHRENLSDEEKAKFLTRIAELENLFHTKSTGHQKEGDINQTELAKITGINRRNISKIFDVYRMRKAMPLTGVSYSQIRETADIQDEGTRKRILEKVKKDDMGGRKVREIVQIVKKAPEEVKEAILSDEISTRQAESLSKIHSPKAREKALEQVKQHKKVAKQHEHIADITPKLMERAKPELTDAVKRQFDTARKRIFTHLNDAKTSLSKVNNNLKQANMMLSQLISQPFEYGLPKRNLIAIMQQIKSISDRLNELEIQNERFDDLKDVFLGRVGDRLEELK